MRYNIRHTTVYSYTDPVPVCHNQVHLAPRDTAAQSCREHRLVIDPRPSIRAKRLDYFGNEVEYFSIQEAHDGLSVTAMSLVDVASPVLKKGVKTPAWEEVAAAIPTNLTPQGLAVYYLTLPSPRIRPSAALAEYALPSFPAGRPIFDAVRDLTARIHSEFTFDAKATTVHTPPEELLELRARRVPGFRPSGGRLLAIAGTGGAVRERLRGDAAAARHAAARRGRRLARLDQCVLRPAGLGRLRSDERRGGRRSAHHDRLGPRLRRHLPDSGRVRRRRAPQHERRRRRDSAAGDQVSAAPE